MSAPAIAPVMVHLVLDGETIFVPKGTPILEVAWNKKIDIPILCHEQRRNPVGVCRVCVVNVNGRAYAAACMLKAEINDLKKNPSDPDLVIDASSDMVKEARKTILQLLMSEHPQPCVAPEHKLQCELEWLAEKLDVPETPYARTPAGSSRGQDTSSHSIRVNHDACILCDRCIRACADEQHYVIARQGKGHEAKIAFGLGNPMYSSGCVSCGACVVACPTTAITSIANSPAYNPGETRWLGQRTGHTTPSLSLQCETLLQKGHTVNVNDLLQYPQFQHVSRKFLQQNLDCVVVRRFKKGEALFVEGTPGHTAFLIMEGTVDIFMRPRDGQDVKSGDLGPWGVRQRARGPGDLTGEMSCLNCYPRSATAIAASDCIVLEMLRNVLGMIRNYRFRDQLDLQYRNRALDLLVKDNKLFASLTAEFVEHLRGSATRKCFNEGDIIFRQDDPADAFYLVSLGFVKISRKYRGGEFVFKYLGPGNHFGEISLLTDQKHHATCAALHHVEVIRIDGQCFHEMVEGFPEIKKQLQKEVAEHAAENQKHWLLFNDHVVEQAEMGLEEAESMLVLDLDKCTRCDQCVIACADTHGGTTRLIRDGLRVDHYLVASACRHCHDPLCMVCHWDAITRDYNDESRAVVIHQDKCVGCGQCAAHCPYGNIKLIDEKGMIVPFEFLLDGSKRVDLTAKASSCDLCQKYDEPSCVYACPHDAAHRYSAAKFRSVRNPESSGRRD